MATELAELYDNPERLSLPALDAREMSPPDGTYLIAFEEGRAVAGGGLRRFDEQTAEIKRMFVVPDARHRGYAATLLAALEGAARELGYGFARLDTGPKQGHAQRLYERFGYRAIEPYNDNPFASFWGEKGLGD
jgi:GNAT superfamily N-acetyltransferase